MAWLTPVCDLSVLLYELVCVLVQIVWSLLLAWRALLVIGFACLYIYLYLTWHFKTFHKDIPGPKPWPIFGTMMPLLTKGIRAADNVLISSFGKVVRTFEGRCPVLLVTDTSLLRRILIKEFSYFTNRRGAGSINAPFNKSLTNLKDGNWKRVRSKLTPAFSSKRLKEMLPAIEEHSNEAVRFISKEDERMCQINVSELCAKYSMDVMAASVLGTDFGVTRGENAELCNFGLQSLRFNVSRIKSFLLLTLPGCDQLFRLLNISLHPKRATNYFISTIDSIINNNKCDPESRSASILSYLTRKASVTADHPHKQKHSSNHHHQKDELTKNKYIKHNVTEQPHTGLSMDEIRAQVMQLYVAGFENNSRSLVFTLYLLASNQAAQQRLRQEIMATSVEEASTQKLNMKYIQSLSYLDMCISESLRLYPPPQRINRVCSRTVHIDKLAIPGGSSVVVPIHALHRDPHLWDQPDQFLPERFENVHLRTKSTYAWMPFGAGPRHCIGMRLALLQIKVLIIKLVSNYKIQIADKTAIPLHFKPHGLLQTRNDVYLKFVPLLE